MPTGWRTGSVGPQREAKLKQRLNEHARSISAAHNLDINDFTCKFLIIPHEQSEVISVIESRLIMLLRPIWNSSVDGFGNHDPGKGRYNQAKSEWDKAHPGRSWVEKLQG